MPKTTFMIEINDLVLLSPDKKVVNLNLSSPLDADACEELAKLLIDCARILRKED